MGLFSDIFSGIVGAGQSIYNMINSERDRRYQENLQQTMFQREDNAVQRRMNDLQAAGLNPNLAAGSSAQAGSVVGRSETPKQDFGSFLDTISAINQIRQQKQSIENAKVEKEILDNQRNDSNIQHQLNRMNFFNQLGLPYSVEVSKGKEGQLVTTFGADFSDEYGKSWTFKEDTPYYKNFNAALNYALTSADLLNRDAEWYTADKVSGLVLNLLGAGANLKRVYK